MPFRRNMAYLFVVKATPTTAVRLDSAGAIDNAPLSAVGRTTSCVSPCTRATQPFSGSCPYGSFTMSNWASGTACGSSSASVKQGLRRLQNRNREGTLSIARYVSPHGRPVGTERRSRLLQPKDGAASSRVHRRNLRRRARVTFSGVGTAMDDELLATVAGYAGANPRHRPGACRHRQHACARERACGLARGPRAAGESSCFRSVGQPAAKRHAVRTVDAVVPEKQRHCPSDWGRRRGFAPAQPAVCTFALTDVATNTSMPRAPAREAG